MKDRQAKAEEAESAAALGQTELVIVEGDEYEEYHKQFHDDLKKQAAKRPLDEWRLEGLTDDDVDAATDFLPEDRKMEVRNYWKQYNASIGVEDV